MYGIFKIDAGKDYCARGCMAMIGKGKLRAIRRYYFSLTGNEQDTYLTTKMQMVKDICSQDADGEGQYLLSIICSQDANVVELLSKLHYVLAT